MIYIATHATLDKNAGRANPVHSEDGEWELTRLGNLLAQLETPGLSYRATSINLVIVGTGTRFEETFSIAASDILCHVPVVYCDLMGIGVSRVGNRVVTPMGTHMPDQNHYGLRRSLRPKVVWDEILGFTIPEMVRTHNPDVKESELLKGDQLICTGREVPLALGAPDGENEHYSNSILLACTVNSTLWWLVKNGELLPTPVNIPLQFG